MYLTQLIVIWLATEEEPCKIRSCTDTYLRNDTALFSLLDPILRGLHLLFIGILTVSSVYVSLLVCPYKLINEEKPDSGHGRVGPVLGDSKHLHTYVI